MFTALIGDLFSSRAQALVNTVNCVGIMGKGVAQEFKKRYPSMFKDYVERCARRQVRLGEPYLFKESTGKLIINFPTKDHCGHRHV
jgi:O-acetyl-ADP-ribose deacetylase (regulator of RNase III)